MMNEHFLIDAAVLVVTFLGAFISLIRTFSSVTPKFKDYLWMGPFAFLMPGVMKHNNNSDLIRFLIFFGFGVVYFLIRME